MNLSALDLLNFLNNLNIVPKKKTFYVLTSEPGFTLSEETLKNEKIDLEFKKLFENKILLACCKNVNLRWMDNVVLMPDFYTLFNDRGKVDALLENIVRFEDRQNFCFFIGSITGSPIPLTMEKIKNIPRLNLLEYSNTHQFVKCLVSETKFIDKSAHKKRVCPQKDIWIWFEKYHKGKISPKMSYEEFLKFKYLLCFDGFGAPWGRTSAILATGSVLLLQTEFPQWFTHLLVPYNFENCNIEKANYIKIEKDLGNLESVYVWLEGNNDKAKIIGENGKILASKYFTIDHNKLFFKTFLTK